MAAVYSFLESGVQICVENILPENSTDLLPECKEDSDSGNKVLTKDGVGLSSGGSAPEAQEHAAAISLLIPIQIKEEPVEENDYVTVCVANDEQDEDSEETDRSSVVSDEDENSKGNFLCSFV